MTEITFAEALNDPRYLIRIDELEISTRLRNALINRLWDRDRIYLIDVIRETQANLERSPNLGKKTIGELMKALGDIELSLGVNVKDYPNTGGDARIEAARQRFEVDGSIRTLLTQSAMRQERPAHAEVAEIKLEEALNDPRYWIRCDELALSTRLAKALKGDHYEYLFDVVQLTKETLRLHPNIGRLTLNELQRVLGVFELSLGLDVKYGPFFSWEDVESARARHVASGAIAGLLTERTAQMHETAKVSFEDAIAVLKDVSMSDEQIARLRASPEMTSELLKLFKRAKALTGQQGRVPHGPMLSRPDDVAPALSALKKDRTPE